MIGHSRPNGIGYSDSQALTFCTDLRSCKVLELAANQNAEVCWYMPVTREQVWNFIGWAAGTQW
jgi:hypothetical protein